MKRPQIRIVEINVHRSKKNPKLGHVVAILFPCSHHKYLGLTLYKGEGETYATNDARVIKFEDYSIMDKEHCKLCPIDDYWLDDLTEPAELNDYVEVLEAMEDEGD